MKHSLGDQTLALAGVVQVAELVHHIAQGEPVQSTEFEALVKSIFVIDPTDIWSVFGNPGNLHSGIATTLTFLKKPDPNKLVIMRYGLTLLAVEKSLRKAPSCVAQLSEGIRLIDRDRRDLSDSELHNRMARLYKATLSSLQPRIKVMGRSEILSRRDVADQIRCLLLAGVRSAWLWHQLGGRRWKLILQRGALRGALEPYLTSPEIH